MSEATARLDLPFILPGQAQKELFHNEALTRIDVALHAAVEGAALGVPPATPGEGQCWIVAVGATGAWAGKDGSIAGWTSGGWRFISPGIGMTAWDKAAGVHHRWMGDAWRTGELAGSILVIGGKKVVGERQPDVPSPSGGSVIDLEARSAIVALTATLKSHGLID